MAFFIIFFLVVVFITVAYKMNKENNQDQYGAVEKNIKSAGSASNTPSTFDKTAYDNKNKETISKFEAKYDLKTVDGILSIPVPQHKQTSEPFSVVSMPEQILQKKATAYKKENKLELAIACLKKSNEFMNVSWYDYSIKDYMRLIDFLYMNSQFAEAKSERQKIYNYFGYNEVEMYIGLMNRACANDAEKEEYYKRVVAPAKEEFADREDYYWLLENLPDAAPKSFGGYRRMKNMNSANYIKLAELAKEKGRTIN
ncbi:MAG: hypothetical protein ACLVG9_03595 [Eubacteriales bacterium]